MQLKLNRVSFFSGEDHIYINDTCWSSNTFISYIVLKEGTNASWFNEQLKEFTRKHMGEEKHDAWIAKGNNIEYYVDISCSRMDI